MVLTAGGSEALSFLEVALGGEVVVDLSPPWPQPRHRVLGVQNSALTAYERV